MCRHTNRQEGVVPNSRIAYRRRNAFTLRCGLERVVCMTPLIAHPMGNRRASEESGGAGCYAERCYGAISGWKQRRCGRRERRIHPPNPAPCEACWLAANLTFGSGQVRSVAQAYNVKRVAKGGSTATLVLGDGRFERMRRRPHHPFELASDGERVLGRYGAIWANASWEWWQIGAWWQHEIYNLQHYQRE